MNTNRSFESNQRQGAYSPYGIRFEDEESYRKKQQQKYKEDLDYLCSLRKKRYNTYQDDQEQMKKIQQMNDKYNYERMSQKILEREFNSYNQKEAMQKRIEKENEKKQRYNEYMTNLQQYQNQCDLQKKLEREKKEKRRQELENDLYSYYQRKDKERLDKIQEGKLNQQLFEQQNDYRNNMYNIETK